MVRGAALCGVLLCLFLAGCAQPQTTVDDPGAKTIKIPAVDSLNLLGDAVAASIPGHRASEFTVARDPLDENHVIGAAMDWDGAAGIIQCITFVTFDAGASWTQTPALPGHSPTGEDTDPWIAFDDLGRVYLTCNEGGAGLLLSKSEDGGKTWGTAQVIQTGGLPIKAAIGAYGDGELVLCFQQSGVLQVMTSRDGGATWPTNRAFPELSAGCNGVIKGGGGRIYALWQGGGQVEADNPAPGPPSVGMVYSEDNGTTWTFMTLDSSLGTAPVNMQGAPQAAAASFARSPVTGNVFIAAQQYQNAEIVGPVSTESRAETLLFRVRPQTTLFSNLKPPPLGTGSCNSNEDPTVTPCNQVHPVVTVDPDGRVILQVMLSDDKSLHKEVWVTVSDDEGNTWRDAVRIATTDIDQSWVSPGNFVGDPQAVATWAEEVAKDPTAVQGAAQGRVTALTWPVFHRDGGEYFGITSRQDAVLDLWIQHGSDGRNLILSQSVAIVNNADG